jgi:hypothetical protein
MDPLLLILSLPLMPMVPLPKLTLFLLTATTDTKTHVFQPFNP